MLKVDALICCERLMPVALRLLTLNCEGLASGFADCGGRVLGRGVVGRTR